MFLVAALAVLVGMCLALGRALLGPTVYDRLLALNLFGTKTVLIIAVLGFLTGRPDFLDLALVYALMNFIGVIAVLKFIRYGDLGRAAPDHTSVRTAIDRPVSDRNQARPDRFEGDSQ